MSADPRKDASVSRRAYEVLLRLYPSSFRRQHGEEMIQTFLEMEREAENGLALWRQIGPDLVTSLISQYLNKPPSDIVLFACATCLPFLVMLALAFVHSVFDWYWPYVRMTQLLFAHPWLAVAAIFVLPAFGILAILIGLFADLRVEHSWNPFRLGFLRRHSPVIMLAGLCTAIVLFLPLHYRAPCTVNGVPYRGIERTLALLQSCQLGDLNNNCGPQINESSWVFMCCRIAGITDLCLKKNVADLPPI